MDARNPLIILGVAVLLAVGMASLGNAQYSDMGSERELCLQDCRQWIGEFGGYRGPSRGASDAQYRLYVRCVERCERKFWKEFDEKVKE